jgi:hypothetical protein
MVLGCIAISGILTAGSATAAPVTPNFTSASCCFYAGPIYNQLGADRGSVKCLDADLNTIGADGTKVQLWTCNGSPQQQWFLYSDGTIRNGLSGRCLDADTKTAFVLGGKVQLWDCNGGPQQIWDQHGAGGGGTARKSFTDELDALCLDADTKTIGTNGTRVQRWACNGTAQQQWYGIGWP